MSEPREAGTRRHRWMPLETGPNKTCSKCRTSKPREGFGPDKSSRDGLKAQCRDCQRLYDGTRPRQERRKADQAARKIAEPQKFRARALAHNAVRKGWIPRPEPFLTWWNRWEFHHPDHSRPYYGCWVRIIEHRNIDNGNIPCPPCTDYTETVRSALLECWGLA